MNDDTATTWRDLSSQLTRSQVLRFECHEQLLRTPEDGQDLTSRGRWEARQNLNDAYRFGHIPLPAGCTAPGHWKADNAGIWTRTVEFSRRSEDRPGSDSTVYLDGVQASDGTVQWSLFVLADDREPLSVDQARSFAAMIATAADELERLR
ncbi:hypothetical protein [Mycobacterium camsae]|uniref:hypothetical protein n=1 Tax=Mycobacterium gordonae TaxID=1778 RepID=UPI00197ED644|nr:hypothetical protein [Mycobacterium gordonae]